MLQTQPKIKLVAIAKDEAAYLPEWISHHLDIGFDEIDIYVNNTSDNTFDIAQKLEPLKSVTFIDADYIFAGKYSHPQETAYKIAHEKAIQDNFDYIMFLDIDEFWISTKKNAGIQQVLKELSYPQVLNLTWFIHHEDNKFAGVYDNPIRGKNNRWLKTIFSLKLNTERIDVHNIKAKNTRYTLIDGTEWQFKNYGKDAALLPKHLNINRTSFVLHRMYRSEEEYISLLFRGRPKKVGSRFKTNRNGFCKINDRLETINLPLGEYETKKNKFQTFVNEYQLAEDIKKAREYILHRRNKACNAISNSDKSEFNVLKKILKNVTYKPAVTAYDTYIKKITSSVRHKTLNTIRSLAISIEDIDVETAQKLMKIAFDLNPEGKLIISKLRDYASKIEDNKYI